MSITDTLKPEFIRASVNLASKSIVNWGKWEETEGFPVNEDWEEKLLFVDDTLKTALEPLQHRPNERMFWRTRPDLNKYRGWLLNRVLQHQLDIQIGNEDSKFILPEDLPKLADDLYAFHKNHGELGKQNGISAGTIQHYKSLKELNKAVSSYAADFPLKYTDRINAHDKFLEEHGGNGEAKRIAELSDGTEIIQVLTEKASIAYGTPRWCTAYRDQKTYFESYKDDLLIMIDPDGKRWQFHFRMQHFQDEHDCSVGSLADFLEDREELAETFAPFLEKELRRQSVLLASNNGFDVRAFARIWKLALDVPAFKQKIFSNNDVLEEAFSMAVSGKNAWGLRAALSLMKISQERTEFAQMITPHLFDRGLGFFTWNAIDGNYGLKEEFESFWKSILAVPEWREKIVESERFSKIVDVLLEKEGEISTKNFYDFMRCIHKNEEASRLLEPYITEQVMQAFHDGVKKRSDLGYPYKEFCHLMLSNPVWREKAVSGNLITHMQNNIDYIFQALEVERNKTYDTREIGVLQKHVDALKQEVAQADGERKAKRQEDLRRHQRAIEAALERNEKRAIEDQNRYKSHYIHLCQRMVGIPEWLGHAQGQGYFAKAVEEGFLAEQFDKYEDKARNGDFWGWHPRDYNKSLWPSVLAIPEWREHALTENRLARMMDILFSEEAKPKRGLGHFINEGKRNDPARTFMFMMPLFANRPEFRGAMTPYVQEALKMARGDRATFKLRYGRGIGELNVAAEILKYASQVKEWRRAIQPSHIKDVLKFEDTVPAVLKWATGNIKTDWKDAVLEAEGVPEFLKSGSYKVDRVRATIASHPPYQEVFGQHLQ